MNKVVFRKDWYDNGVPKGWFTFIVAVDKWKGFMPFDTMVTLGCHKIAYHELGKRMIEGLILYDNLYLESRMLNVLKKNKI